LGVGDAAGIGMRVAVGIGGRGVGVGGRGVAVGSRDVAVGGLGVDVGVAVGGSGVEVGVGALRVRVVVGVRLGVEVARAAGIEPGREISREAPIKATAITATPIRIGGDREKRRSIGGNVVGSRVSISVGCSSTTLPASAPSNDLAISPAVPYRSCGCLAIALSTTPSTAGESRGFTSCKGIGRS
jgi:hypothetical protein